jgi:hypothetical protein
VQQTRIPNVEVFLCVRSYQVSPHGVGEALAVEVSVIWRARISCWRRGEESTSEGILIAIRGLLDLLSREYHLRFPRLTRVSATRRSLAALTQTSGENSNLPGILWVPMWFAVAKAATTGDSHEGGKEREVTETKALR